MTAGVQRCVAAVTSSEPIDYEAFRKSFTKAYNSWFRSRSIEPILRSIIESYDLTAEQFDNLTGNRQLQRYITLVDGKIRFEELPETPHGEIIGALIQLLNMQMVGPNDVQTQVLLMTNDNGTLPYGKFLILSSDIRLNDTSIKRPDISYTILPPRIPQPQPAWLQLQPNGHPYPNLVVEVAVNHESAQKLLSDMQRYFTRRTSIRIWIGVKYWAAGRKFWVGWAERKPNGVGGTLHTAMDWPQNHHHIDLATNLVYNIPMNTIYGPDIPMPPNLPPTLDLDTDAIRSVILSSEV
jgi:hypothetical protein